MSKTVADEDHLDEDLNIQSAIIPDDLAGVRLDKAMAVLFPDHSRARLQALIDAGEVLVNNKQQTAASHKVLAGQAIVFRQPEPVEANPEPENIPLDIVYEDDHLLVINKSVGMVVHPGAGNWTGTLVNALLHHCGDSLSGIGGVIRPGIVHRLDRETSGLMVVAKDDTTHRGLSEQLADRSLSRTYTALVWKKIEAKGIVDKPIARHHIHRQRMHVPLRGGREARTHYRRIAVFHDTVSHIECDLETGRTHQIRVHMESIGHPLLGDPVYGLQKNAQESLLKKGGYDGASAAEILGFSRQALHASRIRFFHPVFDRDMAFEAPVPPDFAMVFSVLNQ